MIDEGSLLAEGLDFEPLVRSFQIENLHEIVVEVRLELAAIIEQPVQVGLQIALEDPIERNIDELRQREVLG